MEKPIYHDSEPLYEDWLDNDTFLITFSGRLEQEGDEKCFKQLYAEVHIDEDNKVVIGENWYEPISNEYVTTSGDFIDENYEFIDMSEELKQEIIDYTLERMKSY